MELQLACIGHPAIVGLSLQVAGALPCSTTPESLCQTFPEPAGFTTPSRRRLASALWIGTLKPSCWVEGSRPGINQMHVAFVAKDEATVEEFHRAALAAGGRDFGKPGPRQENYYGAFVLDPDGNNIEAVARSAPASA